MKPDLFGAARAVTGSCHCVECGERRFWWTAACSRAGRAGQPGAGLCRRVHRRRGGHPRPHRPLRPHPPAGEAGLHRQHLLHPPDGAASVHHAAGLGSHPGERRPVAEPEGASGPGREPVEPLYTVHDAEGGGQAHRHLRVRYHASDRRRGEGALRGRRAPAGLGQRGDVAHRGGHHPQRWSSPATSATGISPSSATPSTSGTPTMCSPRAPTATGSTTWTSSRTTPPTWPPLLTRLWAMGAT